MGRIWKVVGGLAGAAGLLAGVTACAGLEKQVIGERLFALGKNAPLRAAGVSVRAGRARIGGRELEAEFRFVHLPARAGASGGGVGPGGLAGGD